jgi:hypothetical protein
MHAVAANSAGLGGSRDNEEQAQLDAATKGRCAAGRIRHESDDYVESRQIDEISAGRVS